MLLNYSLHRVKVDEQHRLSLIYIRITLMVNLRLSHGLFAMSAAVDCCLAARCACLPTQVDYDLLLAKFWLPELTSLDAVVETETADSQGDAKTGAENADTTPDSKNADDDTGNDDDDSDEEPTGENSTTESAGKRDRKDVEVFMCWREICINFCLVQVERRGGVFTLGQSAGGDSVCAWCVLYRTA